MNVKLRARKGDTLWYMSQLFNLPPILVIESNRTIEPTSLKVGQTVAIPGYEIGNYTVKAGDTLWRMAKQLSLPVDALLLLNQEISVSTLQIGQTIQIPKRVDKLVVDGEKRYDYDAFLADVHQLETLYPFIRVETIGRSVMGKRLIEIRIGNGEKKVHMNGSFHANEWITTPILMETVNQYLLSLTNYTPIRGLTMLPFYEAVELSVVPMVNPDGVDLVINGAPNREPYRTNVLNINAGSDDFSGWKANIRGVDLNNQYPAEWEIEAARKPTEPSPRDYPGKAPLTEPEALALANLANERNFARVLAYHTQGRVIFWGFEGYEPEESEIIVNEFARVSGYEPIRYVDSYAGYKDWFIQTFRRPGFTVELGLGVNPLPIEQFPQIYEENLGIFLASLYM